MKYLARYRQWLLEDKYGGVATPAFFRDLQRLRGGEPVDYVIGFSRFLGCEIDLSRRPLIPRAETEYWVEHAIDEVRERFGVSPACLDIFAGSGCIGCSVLKRLPMARMTFAEKNADFFPGIRATLRRNRIAAARARCVASDVFSHVRGRYDVIFANPPYIAVERRGRVARSVLSYEPHAALFAGRGGFQFIDKILSDVGAHLRPGGLLYIEFDSPQKKALATRLDTSFNFDFRKDQYGRWRWIVVRRL